MQSRRDQRKLLQSFKSLADELNREIDVAELLDKVAEEALRLTDARWAAAARISSGSTEHLGQVGDTSRTRASELVTLVAERGEIVRGELEPPAEGDDEGAWSFVGVPLGGREAVAGALLVARGRDADPFDDETLDVLCVLGSLAAAGIGNATMREFEGMRHDRSAVLQRLAARVRHSLDTREVLQSTVEELGRAADVQRCFIRMTEQPGQHLLGPTEFEWTAPGTEPLSKDPEHQYPLAALAAISRMTQMSNDIMTDERLLDPDLPGSVQDLLEKGTRAALAAPLQWGDELLGVVAFHCAEPREWTDADVELIESAAAEVAVGLHHARLYSQAVETADDLAKLDELRREFVSMVSHELRSPMTVVAGIADLLQKRSDDLAPDQRKELIDTLGREARRLARLVSEMLDLESIDQGAMSLHPRRIDLADVAREAIKDTGQGERARLEVTGADTVILADRDRIKQVFINLLSNAAKFSPETEAIDVVVAAENGEVVVSVADRGPGMTPEETERLFKRFSRIASTSAEKPGSGLGLYLSKVFVEKHGGRIWVDSTPGKGSKFAFRLPKHAEAP